jgi:hypothetical protein
MTENLENLRRIIAIACEAAGWDPPHWDEVGTDPGEWEAMSPEQQHLERFEDMVLEARKTSYFDMVLEYRKNGIRREFGGWYFPYGYEQATTNAWNAAWDGFEDSAVAALQLAEALCKEADAEDEQKRIEWNDEQTRWHEEYQMELEAEEEARWGTGVEDDGEDDDIPDSYDDPNCYEEVTP